MIAETFGGISHCVAIGFCRKKCPLLNQHKHKAFGFSKILFVAETVTLTILLPQMEAEETSAEILLELKNDWRLTYVMNSVLTCRRLSSEFQCNAFWEHQKLLSLMDSFTLIQKYSSYCRTRLHFCNHCQILPDCTIKRRFAVLGSVCTWHHWIIATVTI